jgi:hypothetical protein
VRALRGFRTNDAIGTFSTSPMRVSFAFALVFGDSNRLRLGTHQAKIAEAGAKSAPRDSATGLSTSPNDFDRLGLALMERIE